MIPVYIAAVVAVIIIIWLACFLYLNDFSLPDADLSPFKRILLVYPHPDDEVLTVGGLVQRVSPKTRTTLLLLTKGEKGTPDGTLDLSLKSVRTKEALAVKKILGLSKLIHLDYGDGDLKNKKNQIKRVISSHIKEEKPDLVITYDLSGLYGHNDHIAVSEAVTELVAHTYRNVSLWYASFPRRVLQMAKLPVHMASDNNFMKKRKIPSHKIFIGGLVLNKIQAIYAHKSQLPAYRKGIPYRIPMRFYYSMTLFEYFYKVK